MRKRRLSEGFWDAPLCSLCTWRALGALHVEQPFNFFEPREEDAMLIPPAVGKLRHRALGVTCRPCHNVFCLQWAPLGPSVKVKVWLPKLFLLLGAEPPRGSLTGGGSPLALIPTGLQPGFCLWAQTRYRAEAATYPLVPQT